MSFEAVAFAMRSNIGHPLAKLVLIRFADATGGSGAINMGDMVHFTGATEDQINEALTYLTDRGVLEWLGGACNRRKGAKV